ncbi:hypothetical protein [Streptomyces sp. PAN_FS17]|uniref:hypothetical protein n=1 Tax=Streptomyces sp. PAN_FS17 TaxID=1855351 RepID=UPI00115FB593|nr:hypothetical protein [Streptomyces sp. PAN_FS17]
MAAAALAEVGVGVRVAVAGAVVATAEREGLPVAALEEVLGNLVTEGEDEEGASASARGPDDSWHPASSRIPPITTVTDVPLRRGTASPLFER